MTLPQALPTPRPALFDAEPALERRVPWVPLGWFPTPIERVLGLVPDSVELWVMREDACALSYGGNKIRKLEFLLAAALDQGARRVVTVGGIGSHHVLATAIYGAQLGLEVEAVVFPQPVTAHVREQIRADLAAGATLTPTRGLVGVPLALWRARRRPRTYYIPGGGSSPTGTLGFVSAGFELAAAQAAGRVPRFDRAYVALGSNGTAAGLLVSLGADNVGELVAVRVVDRVIANAGRTRALARAAERLLTPGLRRRARPRLRVAHGFFGGAYGRPTPAAEAAVAAAAAVGLHLETTYTGKALAALLADARAGRLDGKRVLFLDSYSSAPLAPLLARAPAVDDLPPRLRRHFKALL